MQNTVHDYNKDRATEHNHKPFYSRFPTLTREGLFETLDLLTLSVYLLILSSLSFFSKFSLETTSLFLDFSVDRGVYLKSLHP